MGVISYFIDQVERLEAYDADDNLVFPAIAKQEFKGVRVVGRNNTHVKVELEASAQKSGRGFDFTFAYADISVADIVAQGGGPANGYPTITNVSTMVDWLRYAIWGKGAGGAGGGAIESFEIQNDTWKSIKLTDGDGTEYDIQLLQAGRRAIALTAQDTLVVSLPSGFDPPVVTLFRDIGGGVREQFQYGAYEHNTATNVITIRWAGNETGVAYLQ